MNILWTGKLAALVAVHDLWSSRGEGLADGGTNEVYRQGIAVAGFVRSSCAVRRCRV